MVLRFRGVQRQYLATQCALTLKTPAAAPELHSNRMSATARPMNRSASARNPTMPESSKSTRLHAKLSTAAIAWAHFGTFQQPPPQSARAEAWKTHPTTSRTRRSASRRSGQHRVHRRKKALPWGPPRHHHRSQQSGRPRTIPRSKMLSNWQRRGMQPNSAVQLLDQCGCRWRVKAKASSQQSDANAAAGPSRGHRGAAPRRGGANSNATE